MDKKNLFAERLKEARQKSDMSQAELSRMTGIAPATLSTYEKGKMPPIDKALQIAQALHVSLDWLCGNDVERKKDVITFDLKDYLESLAVALVEVNTEFNYDDVNNEATIIITNCKVAHYCKRVNDLLTVYKSGLLSEEMYVSCINKLLSEFNGYYFRFGNVFLNDEVDEAIRTIFDIADRTKLSPGILKVLDHNFEHPFEEKFLLRQSDIDFYFNSDNELPF